MRLLTQALLNRFAQVGPQDDAHNPVIVAKFFNPQGSGTWYAASFDPESGLFFGYVSIFGDHNDEWGYFSLSELESYRGPLGLGIERDRYWQEKRASEAIGEV